MSSSCTAIGTAGYVLLSMLFDLLAHIESVCPHYSCSLSLFFVGKAPEIVSLYALNVTPAYVRHCVRQHFEQNRHVSDTRVVDVLLQKGRIEYQETMNCWKQLDHIMGILLQPKGRPPRTFLQKFYEGSFAVYAFLQEEEAYGYPGRDEDAVLPAATGIVHPKAV